uniref:Endophilin-B1 n=1 Tax=Callorhinchus milii TaxID=7868 RepID=A0A4W3JM18_CALMI
MSPPTPQFTEEKLGQAEVTELDAHFENLLSRADSTKNWTEKILRQTEVLLQPNPSARIEEFLYEKLDRKIPSRITNGELLGQYMIDAASDFGPGTPYGSTLIKVGESQRRLGVADRDFIQSSMINFLTPLRNFLEGDWKTITRERRLLQNRRLDLDATKARLKKAKTAEAKAATMPDFQETRPRNYVLSASASAVRHRKDLDNKYSAFFFYAFSLPLPLPPPHILCYMIGDSFYQLWSEEVDKAEQELRVAQTEFDRQAEVTRLLLEGISSTHTNHLRCLHEFVEAQATYYAQCFQYTVDLQKQLGSSDGEMFPSTFVGNSNPPPSSSGNSPSAATIPVVPARPPNPSASSMSFTELNPACSGTRKARVLYDYDAADTNELSLLADELITVYSLPGMDSDWLMGERGNKKGKVPVTYLELLN